MLEPIITCSPMSDTNLCTIIETCPTIVAIDLFRTVNLFCVTFMDKTTLKGQEEKVCLRKSVFYYLFDIRVGCASRV